MNRVIAVLLLVVASRVAQAQDEVMEVRYGHVVAREPLQEGSATPKGAIIGGLVGLASAHGKSGSTKVKRTAGGAVVGGVIGHQVDRNNRDWLYTVRFPSGEEQQIVIADERLSVGDCAAVEYGRRETAVRYASDYFCRTRGDSVLPDRSSARESNDPCLEAKRRLLDATDPDEIEQLERKVRVICD